MQVGFYFTITHLEVTHKNPTQTSFGPNRLFTLNSTQMPIRRYTYFFVQMILRRDGKEFTGNAQIFCT